MELTEQDNVTVGDPSPEDVATEATSPEAGPVTSSKDIEKHLKTRAEAAKTKRKTFLHEWKANVDRRLGKAAALYVEGATDGTTDAQAPLNPDWSLTKTKTANLFSQVPTVRGTHVNKAYKPAVAPFLKQLNYEIGRKRMDVGVAMKEELNDVVNASGIGGIIVGYAARFESVELPVMDTLPGPNGPMPVAEIPDDVLQQVLAAAKANGTPIPTRTIERPVSDLLFGTRISPTDLLLPTEFVGSDYNKGPWIGRSGGCSWAEALNEFKPTDTSKGLTTADKEAVCQTQEASITETLRSDPERESLLSLEGVRFDELYYWRYKFDPDCKNFKEIWKIVFVHGKTEPVIHEKWKGQRYDEKTRKYVGACLFPIQTLALTYISDNPIPPSDTAAGRPQVDDLRRSRAQMFMNRDRSTPLRWFDVNRIDGTIQDSLMRGVYQGFIPTNGDGSRSIGEIARASYPSEDNSFDQQTKMDLMETWRIGPNQQGTASASSRKTGTEANIEQQNFATGIGQERGEVAAHFLRICEVAAGLMALYSDFSVLTPEEKQAMEGAWDSKAILHDLVFDILPDSTIVLDSGARISKLTTFLNLTAKSGFVNAKPIIEEIAALSGLDPADVVVDPQPQKPDQPNISYRFTGKDDLQNPLVVAMLIHNGQAPTPDELKAAQQMLLTAQAGLPPTPPAAEPAGAPGAPSEPPPPGPEGAPALHPADMHKPEWSISDRIAKRSRDIGAAE